MVLILALSCFLTSPTWAKNEISHLPYKNSKIEIKIDSKKHKVLVDLGGHATSLKKNPGYEVKGKKRYLDPSGKSYKCKIINPKELKVSHQVFKSPFIEVCKENRIGLDFLKEEVLHLDHKKKKLSFLKKLPGKKRKQKKLNKTPKGLFTLKIKVDGLSVEAFIDNQRPKSLIDMAFIKKHAKTFKSQKSQKSQIFYNLNEILIDKMKIQKAKVEALYFNSKLKKEMNNAHFIIGKDLIEKGRWAFDFKRKRYRALP